MIKFLIENYADTDSFADHRYFYECEFTPMLLKNLVVHPKTKTFNLIVSLYDEKFTVQQQDNEGGLVATTDFIVTDMQVAICPTEPNN